MSNLRGTRSAVGTPDGNRDDGPAPDKRRSPHPACALRLASIVELGDVGGGTIPGKPLFGAGPAGRPDVEQAVDVVEETNPATAGEVGSEPGGSGVGAHRLDAGEDSGHAALRILVVDSGLEERRLGSRAVAALEGVLGRDGAAGAVPGDELLFRHLETDAAEAPGT